MNSSLMISTLLIFIVLNKVNNTQITLNGIAALAYCQEKLILEGTSYEEKAISNCLKNFNAKYLQNDIELIESIYKIIDIGLNNKEGIKNLLLNDKKDKKRIGLFGWVLKTLNHLVGHLFLEKFTKWSGDKERIFVFESLNGYKIDIKRYKSFRNYLKETTENLDNLLYLKLGKHYKIFEDIKLYIENKIKQYYLKMVRPNDESDFWWIKPNSRAELLSTAQSRQSTTTNPQLLKSNSAREREKLDSLPISPRSSSSRFSTASQWPKAFDNSFTYTNNAKVFNGETPRLSFEENKDQQIKEIPELLNNLEMRTWQPKVRKVLYLISGELKEEKKQQQNSQQLKIKPITDKERKNQIMKINKYFRSVPINHLFSSPEDLPIKIGLSLSFPKYLQINYEPGFYKFLRGKEPSFPQCEQLKKANKGRINCDYLKEKENLENECSNLLNPKKEKSLDIFSQRIDKILDCVLKYCADKSRIQPGLFGKFNRQFTKLLKSVFGSEDIKWWSGEDNAENIVIVTNNEVIGDIHEKITGQWIDVEPSSITKFIEFETNQPSTSGPSYKSFRIIQESDIKHLGPIRESIVNNLTNRIIW